MTSKNILSSAEHHHSLIQVKFTDDYHFFKCTKCYRFWCKPKYFGLYSFGSILWISWYKCFFLAYISEQLHFKNPWHWKGAHMFRFLSVCQWEAGLALHLSKVYSLHLRFHVTQWLMAWVLFIALLVLDFPLLPPNPSSDWVIQRLLETVQSSFK